MIEAIRLAFERCQRRYPTIFMEFEEFKNRVEEILSRESAVTGYPAADRLRQELLPDKLHLEDLFLAHACSRGDRIAWEYFVDAYLPVLRRCAAQACKCMSRSEDLAQELVTKLLDDRHRFAGYNGRGSLAGWLRVAVSHAAIDHFRRDRKQVSLEDLQDLGQAAASARHGLSAAGESERVDARWGSVLLSVLVEDLRRLPPRERLLLNLYYVQDVPLKAIGRQFGVHEATASRWLERLRQGLRKRIEREMKRRHGLRAGELESLWRWVSEETDFSLQEAVSGCKDV
jgi:RNA polymerase sigma-70 factor (ECF subfamily)